MAAIAAAPAIAPHVGQCAAMQRGGKHHSDRHHSGAHHSRGHHSKKHHSEKHDSTVPQR
jgi:hypothetical protein